MDDHMTVPRSSKRRLTENLPARLWFIPRVCPQTTAHVGLVEYYILHSTQEALEEI